MAADPAFASTPLLWIGQLTTGQATRDNPTTNIVTLGTSPTGGVLIPRIVLRATDNPADSIVIIFVSDGTTNFDRDEFDLGDPAAASTTGIGYTDEHTYSDLWLPATYLLKATVTVTPTAGKINVFASVLGLA
jgi:hypothetical protein